MWSRTSCRLSKRGSEASSTPEGSENADAADTSNPMVTAFRGYVPDFTGSVPGDSQRRIQLGAKLEF